MKKLICILLSVTMILSLASPVFATEAEAEQYGTINVEYSDALGSIERLNVMVKDNHVYADAIALSDRLGYNCIQDANLVSIYADNIFFYQEVPLLAVHFHVNESKVSYNPLFGAEFEYTTPAPCIVDEKGVWVPLTYTLILLGGNSTMLEDTLLVQVPQNNVLSIAATIVNNEDTLSFDWVSHFGYSETTTNITDGAGRIVSLFSGLLEFDGDAWLSLLDWSAFDKKFGKSLATMLCTNSAEELQESIAQVELSLDVFSPNGKAGEMLRNKQIRIDSDVTAWKIACDEYLELLEQGSGSPTKYNLLYQQYERAVDDQSLFSALGGDNAIYIQNVLSSASNVLDVASKVGSAVSYFKEFQQKDTYQISVLKSYLNFRTPTDSMPDATAAAMTNYLASTEGAGQYVFSRFLEEHALELVVDKSGFDAYLGLPANVLLFAWDIMSGTIPFYSEGLEAVENREISNYAQKVQNDALINLKYLIAKLKQSSSLSAEDCVQLSEYCYVYLKACYIARSAAINSLDNTSAEFREQIKGKLEVEADINQLIVQYLSLLSSANEENRCYILGFLAKNNAEYLNNYSDDALLINIDYSTSTSKVSVKQLASIITYSDGRESEEYHFTYNTLGQVVDMEAYRYEDGNAIKWYTQKYEYDENGNKILMENIPTRGSVQSYHYQYNYDSKGQITSYSSIEYYEDKPGPSANYYITYDDQGRVKERRNESGSSVEKFSYGESDNTVYTSKDLHWGDGHFIETTVYDYTYAPLVISIHTSESNEYGNSSSKSISFKPNWNLTIASSAIDDSCSFDIDPDGYLLKVVGVDGENVYVCHYEESIGDSEQSGNAVASEDHAWAAAYIPAVEKAIESLGPSPMYDITYGTLCDLDNDNEEELVLSYYYQELPTPAYFVYDVHDFENGRLNTYAERKKINAGLVAGSYGYIGVEYYNNKPALITYTEMGETWAEEGYPDKKFELIVYDSRTFEPARTLWVHANGSVVIYKINGIEVSEESFSEELTHYSCMDMSDSIWRPIAFEATWDTMTLPEMRDYLYSIVDNSSNGTLSEEQQFAFNSFLTIFSEQSFNIYHPITYESITKGFHSGSPSIPQLINFSYMYSTIHNPDIIYDSLDMNFQVHLSIDQINQDLQKFFGLSITNVDAKKSGFTVSGDAVYFDFGMGETHNSVAIAESVLTQKDGTVVVPFSIFHAEGEYMYAGGNVSDERVYGYSLQDAQTDPEMVYFTSGTAKLKLVQVDGVEQYQLLDYRLDGQS